MPFSRLRLQTKVRLCRPLLALCLGYTFARYSGIRLIRFVRTQQALPGPRVDIFKETSPTPAYTCWTGERNAQFGYAVAFDGNERFGRLGNVFAALRKMTVHAYRAGCSIEFPTDLIGLESFTPPCTLIRLHGTSSSPNQAKCPVLEPKVWFIQRVGPISQKEEDVIRLVLGLYTGTNETHAYSAGCKGRPNIAIHIRAGDVTDGTFDADGNYVSSRYIRDPKCEAIKCKKLSKAIQVRLPFPTAFYVNVLNQIMVDEPGNGIALKIGIYSQGGSNPTSRFFQHAQTLIRNLHNYFDRDLLEDIRDMTCAKHLVLSRGTFRNAVRIRQQQIVHDFVDAADSESDCPSMYRYRLHDGDEYLKLRKNWSNTGKDRNTVDTDYEIVRNPCKVST